MLGVIHKGEALALTVPKLSNKFGVVFSFSLTKNGVFTDFQVVPNSGFRSKTVGDIFPSYFNKTDIVFLLKASDYIGVIPGFINAPFYIKYAYINFDGSYDTPSESQLISSPIVRTELSKTGIPKVGQVPQGTSVPACGANPSPLSIRTNGLLLDEVNVPSGSTSLIFHYVGASIVTNPHTTWADPHILVEATLENNSIVTLFHNNWGFPESVINIPENSKKISVYAGSVDLRAYYTWGDKPPITQGAYWWLVFI